MILHRCDRCFATLMDRDVFRLSVVHSDPRRSGVRSSRNYDVSTDRQYDLELCERCRDGLVEWAKPQDDTTFGRAVAELDKDAVG